MDHLLPPEEDTDLPGFCRALGDAWLRAVCWENPVALSG